MNEITVKPIGIVHSDFQYRYETPRQGVLAGDSTSVIELFPGHNYEQALTGLDGIERIWVIYWFHKSLDSKLMVTPPRNKEKKVGVFATRAPHRPNQIGLSCVKLEKINRLKLIISESDILDGTPVLDIKPYLPYADSFPNAATGWIKSTLEGKYEVLIDTSTLNEIQEIKATQGINLYNYAKVQLQYNPDDISRKRISTSDDNNFILSFRQWKICYSINADKKTVCIIKITS